LLFKLVLDVLEFRLFKFRVHNCEVVESAVAHALDQPAKLFYLLLLGLCFGLALDQFVDLLAPQI
jgi:hypothetical protein